MSLEVELGQQEFLQRGGIYQRALAAKWKSGELERGYTFREYPKMVYISEGFQDVPWETETIKGGTLSGSVRKEVFRQVVVNDEEEEERVLAGGKPSKAIEEERQNLIARARVMGLKVDPSWSSVRLKREMGDKLDAPEPAAPGDKMAALETELAMLRKMADMQAEIERLKAGMARAVAAPASEADDLRQQLATLGVDVDRRWGVSRLREELEAATAPAETA